ncbi:MAG: serine/threonine protein kinase [Novipirellula sp. JB048]
MAKIPPRLGEYRLMRHIRSGASTEIYRAVHVASQDKRVLKILTPKAALSRERVQQLRHEFLVSGPLKHRNVLRAYEFCRHQSYVFLVLEPFLGLSLRQLLLGKQRNAVLEHFPKLTEQMCAAVLHLHQQGWTHGSIKPSNFLINPNFDLKLTDFSLAKRIRKNKFQFWSGKQRPVGSPTYMSPEEIRGQSLDERSDIYSLGCTLFALLEGRVPYSGTNQRDLINNHLDAKTPRVTARGKHITPELVEIIEAMMAKAPVSRPESMQHVQQSIERLFKDVELPSPRDFPAGDAPVSSIERPRPSSPKPPLKLSISTESKPSPKTTQPSPPPERTPKKASVVRSVHWRWLPVAGVIAAIGILVGIGRSPENDDVEQRVLQRFEHLASAMDQPPEFASPSTRQQYWQELHRDVQAEVASAQQQLAAGTSARPDRLELNWSANLLPRVLDPSVNASVKQPLLAILQEHLQNARKHLSRRDEQRSARSQQSSSGTGGSVVFWLVVVADIVIAAMVLRLYLRKRWSRQ